MSLLNALVCGYCSFLVACALVVCGRTRDARLLITALPYEMVGCLDGLANLED